MRKTFEVIESEINTFKTNMDNKYNEDLIKKEEEEVVLLHQAVKDEKDNLKKTVVAAGKAAKAMRESIEKIQTMRPVQVSYGAGSVKIAPMTSSGSTGTEVKKQDQTK